MAKSNFFVKNKSILTFLILEVVALTAFNFGNISYIFGIAGSILAIFGLLFVLMTCNDKKKLLWVLLPTCMLFFVSIIGATNGYSKQFLQTSNIALSFSLPCFFLLGFFLRKLEDVKPQTVLMVIGIGFAAITFFGLASTVIEYGLFYSLIYKAKPLYYYNGEPFNVTKEMFWLNGFEFNEVFVEYGSLFALLSASCLPALLFLSPKKDKREFIIACVVGGVGLLTLLVIPNLKALIVLLVASSFSFAIKYLLNHKKILKILGISFVFIVGLGVLFYILAIINAASGFKFGGFLDRIFVSNGIMANTKAIFAATFIKFEGKLINLFGLSDYSFNANPFKQESYIFEVQLLKEVGIFGAFMFIAFVGVMGYFVYKYIKHSDDHESVKMPLVTMLLNFFIFESLFFVAIIGPHIENDYAAFLRSPTLLVILFILGYLFLPQIGREKAHE